MCSTPFKRTPTTPQQDEALARPAERRKGAQEKRRTKAKLRHLLFPDDYPGDVPQVAEEEASMNAGRPAKGPFAEALAKQCMYAAK